MLQQEHGGQWNWFFPFTTWVVVIELKWPSSAASAITPVSLLASLRPEHLADSFQKTFKIQGITIPWLAQCSAIITVSLLASSLILVSFPGTSSLFSFENSRSLRSTHLHLCSTASLPSDHDSGSISFVSFFCWVSWPPSASLSSPFSSSVRLAPTLVTLLCLPTPSRLHVLSAWHVCFSLLLESYHLSRLIL